MKFLILTILCNLLSSGQLQEINNDRDDYNLMPPDAAGKSDWPAQTFQAVQGNFYGQAQRSVLPKPCSRRSPSEREPINQQVSPPLASKVETLISAVAPLKPQSLRNGNYDHQITNNQVAPPNSQLTKDNKLYNTRNSLTISNPVIDSSEENHHEIIPTINNEQEDNPKPANQVRLAPTSDSLSSSNGIKLTANRRDQPEPSNILRLGPNTEYDAETENNYISEPSNAIASESNVLRSTQINQPSTDKSELSPEFAVEPQTLSPELVVKLLSAHNGATELLNKCSHDKEPNNLIEHSRRSMSSYNDDDNAKDMLSNDKEFLRNNNDGYMESQIDNENAMASVLNVEKNTMKSNKDQNLKRFDKISKSLTHEKPVSRVGRPQFNEARREMIEPTKGDGVVTMGQSALMLMQSERICYACSTANNPSCWAPDRKTTVKYCRKGNNACLTKTFGKGSTFTLIRDCGRTCDDSETGGIMPRYKSCSICHSELCNGAYSINGQSIIFALLLTAVVKYFN